MNTNNYSWTQTHHELALYLKDKRDKTDELLKLLEDAGVTVGTDQIEKGSRSEISQIDPFTFFCYIYKHGDKRRLEILQHLATELDLTYPESERGIPSSNPQKVWMFPYAYQRKGDEFDILWELFEAALNDQITNKLFEGALNIHNVGKTKLTEVLFYVKPDTYFPINGPSKPFLEKKLRIDPSFDSYDEYQNIINQLKQKTDQSFPQLSYDAWVYSNEQLKHQGGFKTDEKHLVKVLQLSDRKIVDDFFQTIDDLFEQSSVNVDSDKLALTVRKNRLNITIGQRYAAVFAPQGYHGQPYAMMSSNSFGSIASESYEFEPQAYLNYFDNLDIIEDYHDQIVESWSGTYSKTNKSSFSNSTNSAFAKALKDTDYRNQLLDGLDYDNSKLELSKHDLFKISLGQEFFTRQEFELFMDTGYISMNERTTGKGRGAGSQYLLFKNEMKIGDYIYVCYSNEGMGHLGRITSEVLDKGTAFNRADESWKYRTFETVAAPVTQNRYTGVGKWWTPNTNSTFDRVPAHEYALANELILQPYYNMSIETTESNNKEAQAHNQYDYMPLNQILYGPPGTGKTYKTIADAIATVNPDFYEKHITNRYAINDRYKKLLITDWSKEKGHISFTTFHQSFSYEDFVEGIKPDISHETENINYIIEDGIFKRMCVLAFFEAYRTSNKTETLEQLSFDEAYDNLLDDIAEQDSNSEDYSFKTKSGGKVLLTGVSEKGNLLVSHVGGERNYTISKIRLRKLHKAFPDLDAVTNIHKEFRAAICGSNATSYYAVLDALKNKIASNIKPVIIPKSYTYEDKAAIVKAESHIDTSNAPPFVMIIDEINRGNVASIFGELITLIESDKRAGAENELSVILPYSKIPFSVPQNLHIIGTMNTADRSIEALDSALRRRFEFVEMMPNYNVIQEELNNKKFASFELSAILKTINKRVTALLDRDHQIGHSYFLKLKDSDNLEQDLKRVFTHKIIPLLQEYFFNDYTKIAMVVGEGFLKTVEQEKDLFAYAQESYEADYEQQVRYEIMDTEDINLEDAIATLMNEKNE